MESNKELLNAIDLIEKEKNIDKESLFEAIELSLISACKKNFGTSDNIRAIIDRNTGGMKVFAQKTVVEEVEDENIEISLEDAKVINHNYQLGDTVDVVITPKDFGRVSAQTAKQVVIQKLREAEKNKVINEFKDKELKLLSGVVERMERGNVFISSAKTELMLLPSEQMPGEEYFVNQRLKVVVLDIRDGNRGGPTISVSRTHPELVARLFEQEVPEIVEGVVEIKVVAREAGFRSKVAVASTNPNVDPVGSCVGASGQRVNIIVDELNGEKIDIIPYDEDVRRFIAASLSPAEVLAVKLDPENKMAKIVVGDNQLSLAIGREGQNARLAAKLTGYKIDIKPYSKSIEEGIVEQEDYFNYNANQAEDVAEYETAAAQYDYAYDDEYYDDEYDDGYYEDDEYDDYYDGDYEGIEPLAEGDDNHQ